MHKIILWRIAQFPLILAIIYLLTFLLVWVAPGSPFETERAIDPIVKQNLEKQFHADSTWSFLGWYPRRILTKGDFGDSLYYRGWTVNDIIRNSLPVSITLGLCALTIALLVGVFVGTLAAVRRGGVLDWTSLSVTLIGISVPSFVTATVLLLVFAYFTRLLPPGGWGGPQHLVLPSLALSLAPMAYIARLTRVSMLDVLGADYVRTARAKGLTRNVVIWKHCLRNAFLPVLSFLGPAAATTLTGSFVVETVFNIQGLGQHFVNSVKNRDQTLVLGVVMVYSAFLLSFNLLVDIAYTLVDPRIDLDAKGGQMTAAAATPIATDFSRARPDSLMRRMLASGRVTVGGSILLAILLCCIITLPFTLNSDFSLYFNLQQPDLARAGPTLSKMAGWFGYDSLGRPILGRCLLGGTISLLVGAVAAAISVVLGVSVGLFAGYKGGVIDSLLMRSVDVLYGLPYILLVILFKIGLERQFQSGTWFTGLLLGIGVIVLLWLCMRAAGFVNEVWARWTIDAAVVVLLIMLLIKLRGPLAKWVTTSDWRAPMAPQTANLVVLFSAIGLVSWLTMARVVRGQVLSLRGQPFVEAARAMGLPSRRILLRHILPNLIGPVTVYATLTIPGAILQESFLSFLGIGVTPPMPTWGSLASDAVTTLSPVRFYWWMLLFPCILLVVTLLSLNFLGDGLRDIFDPKREAAKI